MSTSPTYTETHAPELAANMEPRLILASGFQPDYVREVANAHARLGCPVHVIGGDMHEGQEYGPNVSLLNLRGEDKRDANSLRELAKLAAYYMRIARLAASSPANTLYDVSIGRPLLRCLLMYPLFCLFGKRIVYTAHNVLPHDADTVRNRIVYWIIYRCLVDVIVVHGQSLKERLVAEFDVEADNVHVVAHGTYHPLDTPSITKTDSRTSLGLKQDARILLCFGLQRYYKGTHFLLEALNDYELSDVTLLIRGHAPDKNYRSLLEKQIRFFRGTVAIDAKFGAVTCGEMELLFKAADIVLLPYLEGSQSGIKFMAYAYGRPVLASNTGSVSEHVVPDVTGERFSVGDAAGFRESLERMLARLPLYIEDGVKSYAHDRCSFDSAAKQVHALCARWSQ